MCTRKSPATKKQQDDLRKAIQEIKKAQEITISAGANPFRIAWKNCSKFKMYDYYALVIDIKKLDAKYSKSKYWLEKSSDVKISFPRYPGCTREQENQDQRYNSGIPAKYIKELYTEFDNFFNSNVIPLQAAIAPHSGVNTEVEDLIKILSLFWNIKELSPYAPSITMNALMIGVPPGIRTSLKNLMDDIDSKISNFENLNDTTYNFIKADTDNICNGLITLVDQWSRTPRVTKYSTYRGEASHARDKHVERNFWIMIFFLKMQYELVKNFYSSSSTTSDSKPSTPPKLNEIYSSFLLSWPYSPQLFIDVKDTNDLTISDKKWEEILKNFFDSIPALEIKSRMYNTLDKASEIYPPKEKNHIANHFIFSEHCVLSLFSPADSEIVNCLTPFKPYFAAYYYLDDSWLHRMTHQENGEKYKKALFILLTSYARIPYYEMPFAHETRDAHGNKIYENESHGVIFLPSGEIGSPPPVSREEYRKLLSFLNSTEGKCIQERLDHYLDYDYYSLLYGASSLGVPRLRIWNEIYRSVLKEIGHET